MSASEEARWYSHRRYLYILAQVALVAVAAGLLWQLGRLLAPVLKPVALSLLIAYLLDPLIDWFEARRVNRTLAITLVAFVLSCLAVVLGVVVVPTFVQQFVVTLHKLPSWFDGVYAHVQALLHDTFSYSNAEIAETLKRALASGQEAVLALLTSLWSSFDAVLNGLLVPIFVFYFLRDFDALKEKPLVLVPPRYRDFVLARIRHVDGVVGHWVRGQVEVALVLAALYAIGLSLAGVRLGAVIGIVAGLLNVVPYFGAGIGIVLSVLMVLVEHGGVRELLYVGIVFVVVQLLEGYVITPRLVGGKVGMGPVTIIIALLLFGSLFGLIGLVLAVPLTAALFVLLEDLLEFYRRSSFYDPNAPEEAPPTRVVSQP